MPTRSAAVAPELRPLPRQPRAALRDLARRDPVMGRAIERVGRFALPPGRANLAMLCSSVIGQSISMKAAEKVVERFHGLVGADVTPRRVLRHDEAALRAVGMTGGKARAVRDLATLWQRERLTEPRLLAMPDEAIVGLLTEVKGVGPWTAKMFLIFGLRRPNVMAEEDLGVREGIRRVYGLVERPAARELARMAETWRPWRTIACVTAWQALLVEQGGDLDGDSGWWRREEGVAR